jgi:CRISPR-associated protein Csb2
VPPLFSGHELDGSPARSGQHRHVFLAAADYDGDGRLDRLIVAAPWTCDRSVKPGAGDPTLFDRTVSALKVVRAGKLGIVILTLDAGGIKDLKLLGPARIWESHAFYSPTRPVRRGDDPIDVLRRDAVIECRRRCLPMPDVEILEYSNRPCDQGRLRLSFGTGVHGPLLLGKESHKGVGLFLAVA